VDHLAVARRRFGARVPVPLEEECAGVGPCGELARDGEADRPGADDGVCKVGGLRAVVERWRWAMRVRVRACGGMVWVGWCGYGWERVVGMLFFFLELGKSL